MIKQLALTTFIFSTVHSLSAMMGHGFDPRRAVTPPRAISQGIEIFPGYRNAPVTTSFRNQVLREQNRYAPISSMLTHIESSYPQDFQIYRVSIRRLVEKILREEPTDSDLTISEKELFNLCAQVESKNRRNGQILD